ncbi:endolytic transglycosylase MltG [Propionicicella superfundia]|uniref:endolytic transglycosylase MltG n=1 Tax=Propionicicella superfundia TaxID=348582 RepID=UPI000426B7D3|nr:endolytic transglycosylase MltG [Propionicicella superfundia]
MSPKEPTEVEKGALGRRLKSAFAIVLSLGILIGGGVFAAVKVNEAYYAIRTVEDYIGDGKDDIEVTVPKGMSLGGIGTLLVKADVVKTTRAFSQAVNDEPDASKIQAGKYRLKTQLPAKTALSMLLDSNNLVRTKMTLQEGLTVTQSVAIMAKAGGLEQSEITTALKDASKIGLPSWANKNPEGFLFPETYELPQDPTAVQIVSLTTKQFTKVTNSINFSGRAGENKVSAYQALIIASLIEGEVHTSEYQTKVARVIYNRLAKGMNLQLDSTVHYAVGKSGTVTTTDEDRKNSSPYNTYVHKGLPPGPIGSPGQSALEAAIAPDSGDWLYFVTVDLDTGETLFTSSYEEHEANVKKFQDWCNAHSGRC